MKELNLSYVDLHGVDPEIFSKALINITNVKLVGTNLKQPQLENMFNKISTVHQNLTTLVATLRIPNWFPIQYNNVT